MAKLGAGLWDDPAYVNGTIEPRQPSFDLGSVGKPFRDVYLSGAVQIAAAVNGAAGTFTVNGTTAVVVANTSITANSVVVPSLKTVGGTPGAAPYISAVVPGTSFSMKAAAGDTSVYNYVIIN